MAAHPKRFAIVHMQPNFDSVPCLCSAAHVLAEAGALVDVFTSFDDFHVKPKASHPGITFHEAMPAPRHRRSGIAKMIPGRFVRRFHIRREHRRIPFTAIIASDAEGLIYSHDHLFKDMGLPTVYYSLEIIFRRECKIDHDLKMKEREAELSRNCAMVIVQDEQRAQMLIGENGIRNEVVRLVPNSPLGEPSRPKSTWLRDRLAIPPDNLVVLHAGSPSIWSGLPHLLLSAATWPSNWSLVIQTRSSPIHGDYWKAIELLAARCGATLLTEPLSAEVYPQLLASVDIGCAFYFPQQNQRFIDDNLRFVGRSSGKTANYLLNGIPVITNDANNLATLIAQSKCGEVVDASFDTKAAISRIIENYKWYSQNANHCFGECFAFRRFFDPVAQELISRN